MSCLCPMSFDLLLSLSACLHAWDALIIHVCMMMSLISSLVALGSSLPASYGNLLSLTELVMARNKLVGSIPPSWDGLAYNLSILDLSENQLTGLPLPCRQILLLWVSQCEGAARLLKQTSTCRRASGRAEHQPDQGMASQAVQLAF